MIDDEMSGNVSDCSDDSFEIISADCAEEPGSVISSSYKPSVSFQEIFDIYPVDTDIVARVSFVEEFEKSPEDEVIIVPVAWDSLGQGVCATKLQGNFVKFDVKDLPKTSGDKFYQLCYTSKNKTVKGVSAPFSFREVHEDELMEFQKEQNREFWTFRSRFAILMNTYWNSLVESKRTVDHEENKVTLIDAGNDPFKNEASDEVIPLSGNDVDESEQSGCTTSLSVPTPICNAESNKHVECMMKFFSAEEDYGMIEAIEEILNLFVYLFNDLQKHCQTGYSMSVSIAKDNLETDSPLDLSSLMANVKLDSNAECDNVSKSDDMKKELELIESKRKMEEDYQMAKMKFEKKKRELDFELEDLSRTIEQRKRETEEIVSQELDCLKEENKKLEAELKTMKSHGNTASSQQIRDLMCMNNALQSELNQLKLREVSLLRQVKDCEEMKSSYRALEIELKNTQEFLEYMIEQKDERLEKMTSEAKKGHLYVYDFMKSQFKRRNKDTVRAEVDQGPSTSEQSHYVVASDSSSIVQAAGNEREKVPECEESHLIDQGYENEESRREHIYLLRKLKAWFQDETLDGAEDIRNELRMQYVHMEGCNRHLSSELLRLKKQFDELEMQYARSRSDLIRTEGRLARKVNEKVSLSKLLEASREKISHLSWEGRNYEQSGSIIEGLKREIEYLKSQLTKVVTELEEEKETSRTLKIMMEENEQDFGAQLVHLNFQNQKLSDDIKTTKSDYEMRLKIGAKEFAKLSKKYLRLKDAYHGRYTMYQSTSGSRN